MPLVYIKCHSTFHPNPNQRVNDLQEDAKRAVYFGWSIQEIMNINSVQFGMGEDFPASGTQVLFDPQPFSSFDMNAPEIWVKIEMTEDPNMGIIVIDESSRQKAEAARRLVKNLMCEQLVDRIKELWPRNGLSRIPRLTVDIFWGPGHGSVFDLFGSTELSW